MRSRRAPPNRRQQRKAHPAAAGAAPIHRGPVAGGHRRGTCGGLQRLPERARQRHGAQHRHGAAARRRPAGARAVPRRPDGQGGRGPRRDRSTPFEVQVTQANGQLARDQAQLANARIDLERYQTLLEQDSIAQQQVDTQAALVRQFQGTIEADTVRVDNAKLQLSYTRIIAPAARRARAAPGRRRQHGAAGRHERHRRHHAGAADRRAVLDCRGSPAGGAAPPAGRRRPCRSRRTTATARCSSRRGKLVTVDNQIDPTHRHHQAEGGVRERRRRAVPEPVRQRADAARHAEGRDRRAELRDPARLARHVRVSRERRQHGDDEGR